MPKAVLEIFPYMTDRYGTDSLDRIDAEKNTFSKNVEAEMLPINLCYHPFPPNCVRKAGGQIQGTFGSRLCLSNDLNSLTSQLA